MNADEVLTFQSHQYTPIFVKKYEQTFCGNRGLFVTLQYLFENKIQTNYKADLITGRSESSARDVTCHTLIASCVVHTHYKIQFHGNASGDETLFTKT